MTTIKLKNGSGAPTAGDLVVAEPALDLTNKRLYTEDSGGTVIEVGTNPGTDVTFADNRKAIFGAGSDLQIYHDGGNSRIYDQGTGALVMRSNQLNIQSPTGEKLAIFNQDNDVELYYDDSLKLATTSTGIDVTGTVTADGLTVDSSSGITVNGPTNQDGKLNLVAYAGVQDAEARIQSVRGNTSGTDSRLQFLTNNGTSLLTRVDINDNGDISFYEDTGTTAKLFWDASAESLGIGTSSPSKTLDIEGNIRAKNTEGSSGAEIDITSGGTWRFRSNATTGTNSYGLDIIKGSAGTDVKMSIDSSGNVEIKSGGKLQANRADNARNIQLFNDNDFGTIQTSNDPIKIASQVYTRFDVSGSEAMRIDSSGNVGIGTSSPAQTLHLKSADPVIRLEDSSPDGVYAQIDGAGGGLILSADGGNGSASSFIGFRVDGTASGSEKMRIDSSGKLTYGGISYGVAVDPDGAGGFGAGYNFETNGGSPRHLVTGPVSGQYLSSGSSPFVAWYTATSSAAGTAASERARIDASGNLLVGKTSSSITAAGSEINSSSLKVSVSDTSTNLATNGGAVLNLCNTSATDGNFSNIGGYNSNGLVVSQMNFINLNHASRTGAITLSTHNGSSLNEAMRIDSNGNVQIGSTSSDGRLKIAAASGASAAAELTLWGNNSGAFGGTNIAKSKIDSKTDGTAYGSILRMYTNDTSNNYQERMRIDSSGNLLVGGTSQINSTKTSIYGSSSTNCLGIKNANDSNYLITAQNSSNTEVFRVAGTGNVLNTNNSYSGLSDARLKSSIIDAPSQLDDIMSVQVRSYTLNSTGEKHLGVVAQELEASGMSGLVEEDKEGTKSVKYSVLYMKAVKALQEAITKIEDLESRVAQLEGEN